MHLLSLQTHDRLYPWNSLFGQSTLVFGLPYSFHTSHHPSQTPCLPWIFYAAQKLMLDSWKIVQKQSEAFHMFLWHFSNFKTEFYCISFFSSVRLQFWNSPAIIIMLEPEIIKIGQSSHKMYSKNILNFQELTTILNACTKKSLDTYWRHLVNNTSSRVLVLLVESVIKNVWYVNASVECYFIYYRYFKEYFIASRICKDILL